MGTEIDDAPGRGDVEEIAAAARGDVAAHHMPVPNLAVSPDGRNAAGDPGFGDRSRVPVPCGVLPGSTARGTPASGGTGRGWTTTWDPDDEDAPNLG